MKISAFDPLRPADNDKAKAVASVPYDVVNTEEALALAEGNPDSFLHVVRPEIDLPRGTDLHADEVYAKARENFDGLQTRGSLKRHGRKGVFVYRLTMNGRTQTGVVCRATADEYNRDLIKKHEKTRQDKEDDRFRHVMTLRANAGPVFLTYRDRGAIDGLVAQAIATPPMFDFAAVDGVRHEIWEAPEPEKIVAAFAEQVPASYVADGHHRSASAARAAAACREKNPDHTGEEDYNWFLAVLFPASQLKILPYNRVVFGLNGHSPEAFLAAVGARFDIAKEKPAEPGSPMRFGMYFQGKWMELTPKETVFLEDPVASLDVSILQDRLLGPILGIDDPRKSKNVDFVGGIRGTKELEKRVNSGEAAVAFSLYPTSIQQLMSIADAGEIMPPKSTWFEPKLRSGLLVHTF